MSGRTYRVVNRSVVSGATLSATTVTATSSTANWTFTAAAQTAAYSAHARYVDLDVAEVWDGISGPAATLVYDLWSPLKLGGTDPTMWADAIRQQSVISGGETTHASLFQRTGATKVVIGADGALSAVAANTLAFDYSTGRRRLLLEGAATNLFIGSSAPTAAQAITVRRCIIESVSSGCWSPSIAQRRALPEAGAETDRCGH